MTRIYVPCDSSALALGADALAEAICGEAAQRGIAIELVRNGSRGLLWLEPLVEVDDIQRPGGLCECRCGRCCVPVRRRFYRRRRSPQQVGIVDEIPYLQKQQRLTFARIGITDPLSVGDYLAHGG